MPTYQYACTECGHAFEQFQRFTDDALTACPECQGRLRKLFNAVGVVFKGSGFYRTDSRSGPDKAEKPDKPATTGVEGGSAASSGGSGSGSSGESAGSSPAAPKPAKPAATTGS